MSGGGEKGGRAWRLAKKSYWVRAKVTAAMYDGMLRVLESGAYLGLHDYLRDLIRRDLRGRGIEMEGIGEAVERRPPKVGEVIVSARIPAPLREAVDRALDAGFYHVVSDYVRDLIRRDLEAMGLITSEKEMGFVHARVPIQVKEAIGRLLESGPYFEISDYVRDVIRRDLEERGLLVERGIKDKGERVDD